MITQRSRHRLDRIRAAAAPLHVCVASLALALLLGLASTAVAQDASAPAAPTAPQPPPEPKVQGVAVADLGVEAEKTKSTLARFDAELEPSPVVAEAEKSVADLAAQVAKAIAESKSLREVGSSLANIDEQAIELDNLKSELARAAEVLRDETKSIDQKLEEVRKQRARWTATRESLQQDGAAKKILRVVDEVDAAISSADKKAKKRQARLVELQGRVASLSEAVKQEIAQVGEHKGGISSEMFQPDRQPLWSPEVWEQLASERFWARIQDERDRESSLGVAYVAKHRSLIMLHAVALVVLMGLMLGVRRRLSGSGITDESLTYIRAVFDRPYSLSFLLVIVVTTWTLPDFPRGLGQLVGLGVLLPSILILRGIVDRSAFPMLNALLAFYVTGRIEQLLTQLPDAARIVLTLQMVALAGLLVSWVRPRRLARIPSDVAATGFFRAIGVGMRVALVGAIVAACCSVLGYTALGSLIGMNLLYAAYTAVALYGLVRVLDGLATVLLITRPLRLSRLVRRNRGLIHRRVLWFLQAGALLWWIQLALSRLDIFDDVWDFATTLLSAELSLGDLKIQLGDVAAFAITVWASFVISRFLRFVFEEDVYPRLELAKGMPYAVSALTHYTILLIGFLLAIAALGVDTNRFALLAGAFGVGIGFGLQNIVNNFVSGLILLTERPVEVGDTVAVGETFGLVERIGIRSSTVRTWQGAEVIVPNATLIAEQVTNWTHSDTRRRMEVAVGVPYGSDPQRVINILHDAVTGMESVLEDPEPNVLFMEYGDSALLFEVRAWTSDFDRYLSVRSAMMVRISAALAENGIEIPFPQRDLHLKTLPGATPKASGPSDEEPTT